MIFGSPTTFTIDPKNIQAVLATQFKDFGLGDMRNGNFNPLLGHGIVSSPTLTFSKVFGILIKSSSPPMERNGNRAEPCSGPNLPATKLAT